MQFASLNGVVLHYQVVAAPNDRPTIVFANSLGTDFRIWRDVIIRLVGEAGFVMYDKRGHGLSTTGPTPYAIDDHIGDLEALLDHLGVTKAIICGLSVGGMIAMGLASKRRDLVKALILCDTAPKIGTAAIWNDRIAAIEANGIASVSDMILERWFTKEFRSPGSAELDGYRMMLNRQDPAGYVSTCAAIRDADLTEKARALKLPVACIVGAEDGSTPPSLVAEMARTIPGALYDVIPACGHIPCVERPVELTDIIRGFIGGLDAA